MLSFIDAHSQVDDQLVALADIITRMTDEGVACTILSARGDGTSGSVATFADQHPDKILPALRTKVDAYFENRPLEYSEKLANQLNRHDFAAMQEVLMYHAEKPGRAREVKVFPDDERVNASLAVAAHQNRSWPLVVHIEFAALAPSLSGWFWGGIIGWVWQSIIRPLMIRQREVRSLQDIYLRSRKWAGVKQINPIYWFSGRLQRLLFEIGLDDLLQANRGHPFVMIHMGQLTSSEVKMLIERHPNIYFMTSHTMPTSINASSQPWTSLFEIDRRSGKYRLRHDWKQLIMDYPKRFVFALDNVWDDHWEESYYRAQIACWREALAELPDDVAIAVARGNARMLWNISE